MELKGLNIGFAITGSFCTFRKALDAAKDLAATGANIVPIMSHNSANTDTRFGKAADFIKEIEELSNKKVITTITQAEPIGPKALLDLLIIAPCTGNTLGKLANGITDTSVTMAAKSHLRNARPLLIAISTNDGLSQNAKNIGLLLNTKNIFLVPFGQDDPEGKQSSLVAYMDFVVPAAMAALDGVQMQPLIIQNI